MKKPSLFLVFFVSLAVCACDNPFLANILQPRTITFDSNGGSPVPSQTVLKNEKISRPRDPVKPDYSFRNWFTDNDTFENIWDFDNIPEGDMILFAAWKEEIIYNPAIDDFDIEGANVTYNYDGNPKEVTVTAKPGKTGGEITVYYQQVVNGTYSEKTAAPPINPGTYTVTFDVTAAEGWNAITGLYAGSLVIEITNASGLGDYLNTLSVAPGAPGSDPSKPITIPVKVSNSEELTSITDALNSAPGKYVTLDLTGSSITEIPEMAFTTYIGTTDEDMSKPENYIKCETLTGIILPDGVTDIGFGAFANCINLTSVTIPNGVTDIVMGAFAWCESLTSLYIPDSVKNIGMNAFYSCTGLTEVNIPNKITTIEDGTFDSCSSLASITIPNSVQSIGRDAFSGCTSLAEVTIPINVNSIGQSAFAGCTGLTKVTFKSSDIPQSTATGGGFSNNAFPGDLYNKYFALIGGTVTGGEGTYTRSGTGIAADPYVWTKQP